MKETTLPATIENIGQVTDFVDEQLEKIQCPLKIQTQINIAIDELFGNIAQYAYYPETGQATVQVEIAEEPVSVILTFIDQGRSFNPLANEDPDITLPPEMRQTGGLGIFMVKKTMDEMTYRYERGRNILRICKKI